jgi:hypothetical protein
MPTYSFDELQRMMEPQALRDRALIRRCIDGLVFFAARLAEDDPHSPQIPEYRQLIDTLVSYWGLDSGENVKRAEDYLKIFDDRVKEAAAGGLVNTYTYQTGDDIILGLHRYGMEMVVAQGDSAIADIMSVSKLMKEIGPDIDFEPETLRVLTAELEAEARALEPTTTFSWKNDSSRNIEVHIVRSTGEQPGEWLHLPTDVDTLRGLFERIGGNAGDDYRITDLRLPYEGMEKYVTIHDDLDELNMLAVFLLDTSEYMLQAILTSEVMPIGEGVAALINVLYDDNQDAFVLIDADNTESLGQYYQLENDEVPEGVSYKDYGEKAQKEEGGVFTQWGYIYPRYSDLSPLYPGTVPDEYRIVERARARLRSAVAERNPDEKPSVIGQIRAAKAAPATPTEQPSRQKTKGGLEL